MDKVENPQGTYQLWSEDLDPYSGGMSEWLNRD